jgi:hypothetical protein
VCLPGQGLLLRHLPASELASEHELAELEQRLERYLKRSAHGCVDEMVHDAAVDTILEYIRRPAKFDRARGVPLERFLDGIAWRKLRDYTRSDAARRRREMEWGGQVLAGSTNPEAQAIAKELRWRLESVGATRAERKAIRRWLANDKLELSRIASTLYPDAPQAATRFAIRLRKRVRKVFSQVRSYSG